MKNEGNEMGFLKLLNIYNYLYNYYISTLNWLVKLCKPICKLLQPFRLRSSTWKVMRLPKTKNKKRSRKLAATNVDSPKV